MAVSTMSVQESTMQEWKTQFPEFATLEGSCLFIKKLIAVSLSSITYIRGIFPEKAYGERTLGGLRLKLLTEDCGIKAVTKFIDTIRSCYDAVEKKYLQQLSIGVCTNRDNYNEVIEAYNLVFKYKDDECSVTCNNKMKIFSPKLSDPTVKATFLMLKNITVVNNILEKLPESIYLTLKLLYYDDVTPEDYEPPGFEPSSEPKFSFAQKTMNISLGKVDTDRHGYKFLLKTTFNKQLLSQNDEDPLRSQNSDKKGPDDKNEETATKISKPSGKEKVSWKTKKIASMKCPCKCKLAGEHNVIACTNCKQLQHKTCYGFLNPDENPSSFYCVDCMSYGDYPLADLIYTLLVKERQEFCLTRTAISLFLNQHSFTKLNLEKVLGCSRTMGNAVIAKLIELNFIEKQINAKKYNLKESNTDIVLQKYFPSSENKENEDQMDDNLRFETTPASPQDNQLDSHEGTFSESVDDVTMIESSERKEFRLTRRAITLFLNQHSLTKENLEKMLGCSKAKANAVIAKLIEQDFIKKQINTNKYYLKQSNTDIILQKYFPSNENEELLDEDLRLGTTSASPTNSYLASHQGILSESMDDAIMIESPVRKVRDLKLYDISPARSSISRKRKASSEIVKLDDSADLFQSQKRPRIRKVTRKNKF